MDRYPSELLADPKPLVFIVGNLENEPELQGRLSRCIEETLREAEGIALSIGSGAAGGGSGSQALPNTAPTASSISNSKLISNLTSSSSGVSAEALPPIDIRNVTPAYQFYVSKKKLRRGGGGSSSEGIAAAADNAASTPSQTPLPSSVTSLSPLAGMTSPLSSNSSREAASTQGLFKTNWIHKHANLIPSVTILTVPFNADCTSNEWLRRENAIHDKYVSLKSILSLRDNCKVIVVAVNSSGSVDKETLDEKVLSFKRRMTLDSRTFCLLSSQTELQAFHPILRRLCKTVREFSCNYYNALLRAIKGKEKIPGNVRGTLAEGILLSRYNFKMGFVYEVLGQRALAVKCYRNTLSKYLYPLAKEVDEDLITQVKIFCEWTHLKTVNLLFATNQGKDATSHFKLYITNLLKVFCLLPYTHYKWLTQQYHVYALMLEKFNIKDPSNESEVSYFYMSAAKFCQSQQNSYLRLKDNKYHIGIGTSSDNLVGLSNYDLSSPSIQYVEDTNYISNSPTNGTLVNNSYILLNRHNIKLLPSPYVGGDLLAFSNPGSSSSNASEIVEFEIKEIIWKYLYSEEERQVEHSKLILHYLAQSQQALSPAYKRRRGFVSYMIAEQQLTDLKYSQALVNYKTFLGILSTEKWFTNTIPILRKVMLCTYYLGYLTDFFSVALRLYAFSNQNFLSFYEKIELTTDILAAINSTKSKPISKCLLLDIDNNNSNTKQRVDDSGKGRSISFSESGGAPRDPPSLYGSASLNSHDGDKIEFQFPDNFRVNLLDFSHSDYTNNFNLFECDVKFSKFNCYVGEKVRVQLKVKSNFNCQMCFSELAVVFSKNILNKTFVDSNSSTSSNDNVSNGKIYGSALVLEHNAVLTLDFSIEITEACLPNISENAICVERLLFTYPAAADSDCASRAVIFEAPVNHPLFDSLRSSTATIRDVYSCLQCQQKPSIVSIARPPPEVRLVYPPSVTGSSDPPLLTLLQGPVQRVDLLFTSDSCVKAGKIYLQIDATPNSAAAAFFWYPITSSSNASTDDAAALDAVSFHPIALNSLMQPAHPLLLPALIEEKSSFSVPLFLRSEKHGSFKIKATIEYISRSDFTVPSTKDFIINASFERPLKMTYSVSSTKDCQQGVVKQGNAATICRGDLLNLSATLSCINSLDGEIEVIGMTIHTSDSERGSEKESTKDEAIFEVIGGRKTSDLLNKNGSSSSLTMKKGEIVVGYIKIQCNELRKRSEEARDYSADNASAVTASIGAIFVDWRLKDNKLFKTFDVSNSPSKSLSKDDMASIFSAYKFFDSSDEWLPPVDTSIHIEPALNAEQLPQRRTASGAGGLDKDAIASRVCGMVFGVPAVQVESPPFDVSVTTSSVASIGTPFSVLIDITSKLASLEKLQLFIDFSANRAKGLEMNAMLSSINDSPAPIFDEAFIVSGFSDNSLHIMPYEKVQIAYCVTPLQRGLLSLPRISAKWAKNDANIIALGTPEGSFNVFVQ